MKKTTLLLCLSLLLCLALLISPAAAFTGSGAGTAGDPYQITTRAQLEEISSALGASYILMNNIDLGGSSTPWTPIGTIAAPFTGTFDGNGNTISNLYCHNTIYDGDIASGIGMFFAINGATFDNLGLINVDMYNTKTGDSYSYCGGLVGMITGGDVIISNCFVTGNISGGSVNYDVDIGGILGTTSTAISTTIFDCWSDVTLSGTSAARPANGGGIIGRHYWDHADVITISNCYSLGNITMTGISIDAQRGFTGGIISGNAILNTIPVTITNCVALQSSVSNTQYADRISGYTVITATNNYANSEMIITGTQAGVHGTDVTSAQWATQSWWETYPGWTFDKSSAWYWNSTQNLPNLRVFAPTEIISFIVTPSTGDTSTPYQLTAEITGLGNITYQWQQSINGNPYTNISVDTIYIDSGSSTNISYNTTISQVGPSKFRLILTNKNNETATSSIIEVLVRNLYTPDTITKQTTPDITDDTTSQYKIQTQHILPDSPNKLIYIDQYIAYLAVGNAIYKIQSETALITPISETTGNTIKNAYLGSSNAIITDTDNITAIYNYASGSQTYLSGDNTGIIASTTYYAAVKNNTGYLNLYAANGNLINSTSTTVTQIAANDQTNIIVGHLGTTTLYIWQPSESSITQTTAAIPYAITDVKQIIGTNQFLITTAYKSYIYAITETGVITSEMISSANNPLIHTQSTTSDTIIGTNTNGLYIIDNTGTTIGTYTAGSTLNDASIARLTGLWAITGGDDTQAYFLTKSSTSSWTLEQTSQINKPISHTQISATGTYALICSGTSLYLFKNTDASATLYYLNGIVISSSGAPYGNQSITMNGETIKLDSSGKFVTFVTPGNTYTFVADTTTTQYTASNAALQTIAIQLKPNPYATAITYAAAYNSTSGNIEMTYGDTTGKTESVTWSIYDTVNKTTVYTHTGTLGTETYPISIEESYKNYQVTVTADRGDTSVKNTWTITPSGSSPINLFGLDDTGKNLIFCTVLMIFGGLFGVMHSTKGALAVTALAAWMRYMELITIPWILISIAAVIAIIASLQRGGEGKV